MKTHLKKIVHSIAKYKKVIAKSPVPFKKLAGSHSKSPQIITIIHYIAVNTFYHKVN